ncbi:ExbD/TolR family protein [Marinimicrobium agarilyticum]|uniref:ExbD/TolR family protein n=1 Tax=Marinimicrobium agarilyticum TaxID=306546 RepID=UPI00041F492C|nr:biopolymer transporter ExbD [Marinimicrobium agarilyticum]
MHRDLRQRLDEQEKHEIDLAPLLDVVFILLIFFIVTSVFVQETGVDVNKPSAVSTKTLERSAILIAITSDNQVVYAGTNVGVAGIRSAVSVALRKRDRPVIIQADKDVVTSKLVDVIDQAKLAGADNVSIATVER